MDTGITPPPPPSGNLWVDVAIFAALMVGSAYFAGAETALTGASRARMTALEHNGDARAKLVNKLRERKDMLIGGLLLGNNFVNIFASAFATAVAIRLFGDSGVFFATLAVTFTVLVFGEVMPKTYSLMYPNRVALFMARPVSIVVAIFSPVTTAVSKVVNFLFHLLGVDTRAVAISATAMEEELRGAITLFNRDRMEADQEKGAMLRSILDLADVTVESVMIHRKNVTMIDAEWPIEKIVDEVLQSPYTRLPVWEDNQDNIIGVIHAKLLLNELRACDGNVNKINLKNAMMEPWFIPESTALFNQLQNFRQRREHFALMVDEYGTLQGIVTLEDILEEIVGQIDDEHDIAVTGIKPQGDGHFIIDGKVTIRDLNREMSWRLPHNEDYDTLAGLLLFETRRIPRTGKTYSFYGFQFEVLKMQRNQIIQILVRPPELKKKTSG